MRTLEELIDRDDEAWPFIEKAAAAAVKPIELLPPTQDQAERTLTALQVTTRAPLGSMALRCGGALVDRGWLRLLGSGHARIGGGLIEWNGWLGGRLMNPPVGKALVVAYDALAGFFALNHGQWAGTEGAIWYFDPAERIWVEHGETYSQFLTWAFSEQTNAFYEERRWPGWEEEAAKLGPNEALSIAPPLGFDAGPLEERSRRVVPAPELWALNNVIAKQMES